MSKVNITPDEGYYGLSRVGISVVATEKDITENGDYTGLFRKVNVNVDQHESEIQELEEEIAEKTQQIADLNTQITDLNGQISTLENEKVELQNQITALNVQISTLENEKAELQSQITTLNEQIATLQSEKTELENQITELNNTIDALNSRISDMQKLEEVNITTNGTYTPSGDNYAISKVTVDVAGGELQEKNVIVDKTGASNWETLELSSNGIYTGKYNKVVANVSGTTDYLEKYFNGTLADEDGTIDLSRYGTNALRSYLLAGYGYSFNKLILSDDCTIIPSKAFEGTSVKTSVINNLGSKIETIGDGSFNYVYAEYADDDLIFGDNIKTIGSQVAQSVYVNKIYFGSGITSIGYLGFNYSDRCNFIQLKSLFPTLGGNNFTSFSSSSGTLRVPYGNPSTPPSGWDTLTKKGWTYERYGTCSLNKNNTGVVTVPNIEEVVIPWDIDFDYVNEDGCLPASGTFNETGKLKNCNIGKNTTGADVTKYYTGTINGVDVTFEILQTTVEQSYSVEVPSDVTYGFSETEDEYYESTNQGVDSSFSYCKLSFTGYTTLTLECINYAEKAYDGGLISQLDTDLAKDASRDGDTGSEKVLHNFINESSETPQTITIETDGGEHYLTIKYIKDSSSKSGNDSFKFKVL